MKTSELEGAALDWAVAKAVGGQPDLRPFGGRFYVCFSWDAKKTYSPSTNWSQGGPLIEQNSVWLSDDEFDEHPQTRWAASIQGSGMQEAQTPLIAACRAIVAAKLGDEVDIPEELL